MTDIKKFKTPEEIRAQNQKLIDDVSAIPGEHLTLSEIYNRAKGVINTMLNQENTKLNVMLLVSLKQKMLILERMYNVIDNCMKELEKPGRLGTISIDTVDLMDKTTKLIESFTKMLKELTDKNEIINFSVTNEVTKNNVTGSITLPAETKEKMKMLAMKMMMDRRAPEDQTPAADPIVVMTPAAPAAGPSDDPTSDRQANAYDQAPRRSVAPGDDIMSGPTIRDIDAEVADLINFNEDGELHDR